ncbi:triose-phosphate isomerase [Mariniphaga sediminis]|jgi:triosephosphate isomerase|uniref:Triose-phosphate isomerase n=2 Tax=Mariniphaga sediminis TaxID=1628158 RepID=A0A399D707_9BACT|nr:triose-phosphate isomerase [Mariniphaga sediminis]RIH66938.1 triose-phosphate isomerase [Mariniphaga sediminis]RIH67073.1 triose-phosphate isomerase [Mariniphaga sediminis]
MYKGLTIKPPFFEIGPKAFMYGERILKLALAADKASEKYDVRIIFTPQYTDIQMLAEATQHLLVFAQHMDPLPVGRGLGSVLPEAVKAAGAVGVMLNHAERPMTVSDLNKAIKRADEVGLVSIVCADTIEEAEAIARFSPNIIVAEPTELIGTGQPSDRKYIMETTAAIKKVNPEIQVLQGAGISNGQDVYNVIKAGADATGTTSGIMKAKDPEAMLDEMIRAVRMAWDEVHN